MEIDILPTSLMFIFLIDINVSSKLEIETSHKMGLVCPFYLVSWVIFRQILWKKHGMIWVLKGLKKLALLVDENIKHSVIYKQYEIIHFDSYNLNFGSFNTIIKAVYVRFFQQWINNLVQDKGKSLIRDDKNLSLQESVNWKKPFHL